MDLQGFEVLKYKIGFRSGLLSTAKDLDKRQFDLISTHYSPFDLIASMAHIPHYLHDPGIPPFNLMNGLKDKRFWAIVNTTRLISARNPSCVLPISDYLGKEFKRKYAYGGRMRTLPYGIDFPANMPAGKAPFDKYILYVGRHAPYKGVDKLIEIFSEVKREIGEDVHLITIGNHDGKNRKYLEALASKTGNVHMLGYVPDIWSYYANCSVYATCSLWEGEDRPVIEAQYAGKPVVAFNNSSHPEVISYGDLANNKEEFKNALIRCLEDKKPNTSISSSIFERYSLQKMADRFTGIVQSSS
jgi:1,2-diacylglycerol 3-alpha-glucosyltransferase